MVVIFSSVLESVSVLCLVLVFILGSDFTMPTTTTRTFGWMEIRYRMMMNTGRTVNINIFLFVPWAEAFGLGFMMPAIIYNSTFPAKSWQNHASIGMHRSVIIWQEMSNCGRTRMTHMFGWMEICYRIVIKTGARSHSTWYDSPKEDEITLTRQRLNHIQSCFSYFGFGSCWIRWIRLSWLYWLSMDRWNVYLHYP